LPALVAGFSGRAAELAQVTALLDPAQVAGAVAVAGLAGVGKTALAIQAGHGARAAGWFTGSVLFIDLHGYDDAPVPRDSTPVPGHVRTVREPPRNSLGTKLKTGCPITFR
jgi:hypothetical protein